MTASMTASRSVRRASGEDADRKLDSNRRMGWIEEGGIDLRGVREAKKKAGRPKRRPSAKKAAAKKPRPAVAKVKRRTTRKSARARVRKSARKATRKTKRRAARKVA